MIRDAKGLLRTRLDKLMTPFRLSAPMFYAGYQSARVIGDRKTSSGGRAAVARDPTRKVAQRAGNEDRGKRLEA